jgi:hypothetical protein
MIGARFMGFERNGCLEQVEVKGKSKLCAEHVHVLGNEGAAYPQYAATLNGNVTQGQVPEVDHLAIKAHCH